MRRCHHLRSYLPSYLPSYLRSYLRSSEEPQGWLLGDPGAQQYIRNNVQNCAQKYTSTLPRPLVLSQFWASM